MKIHPRITQISSLFNGARVELYLIRGERNAIIDTGVSISPQKDIVPALRDLGLTLADIDFILNTHGHCDHVGGNAAVKSASNAQICIHADEVTPLEDHGRFFDQYFAPAVEAVFGKERVEDEWAIYSGLAGSEVTVDRQLQDNDIIDLGDGCELRVIHLPGHTSGSVGFYWEREGILFSGDSVSGLHDKDGGLPIISDLEAYEQSLERLQGMSLKFVLNSHYYRGLNTPPSPIRRGEEVRQYLRDSHEAAKQIGEAVRRIAPYSLGKPLMEIADQVVAGLPNEMGFKSMSQIPMALLSFMTILCCLRQLNR